MTDSTSSAKPAASPAASKPAAKKAATTKTAKKPAAKKATKKPAAKKPAAKKATKKPAPKKAAPKKAAKKPVAKKAAKKPAAKSTVKKPAAKKASATKSTTRKAPRKPAARKASRPTSAARKPAQRRGIGSTVFTRVNELVAAGSTAKDAFPVVAKELKMSTANVQQHYYRFKRRAGAKASSTARKTTTKASATSQASVSWVSGLAGQALAIGEDVYGVAANAVGDVSNRVGLPKDVQEQVVDGIKSVGETALSVAGWATERGIDALRRR